jgi:hypothetical protein
VVEAASAAVADELDNAGQRIVGISRAKNPALDAMALSACELQILHPNLSQRRFHVNKCHFTREAPRFVQAAHPEFAQV